MVSTITYSVLLVVYVVVLLRNPPKGLSPGDRQIEGEDRFLRFALWLNLLWLFSWVLPYVVPPLSVADSVIAAGMGVLIFVVGLWIRFVAIRTLGHLFTHKLTIKRDHRLVTEGIYRYIRHPGYTGTLLQGIGMMVAARSWAGLLLFFLSAGTILVLRMFREEMMLKQTFGQEYENYARQTKRLIPWIL